nr:MAG TPA: hypothetical protein [Caudoviricetes sp.]
MIAESNIIYKFLLPLFKSKFNIHEFIISTRSYF